MMDKIFHYGYCSNCNSMKNNVRRELCHILPPQVCEVISDYNVYCYGCRKAKNNEKWVIERGIHLTHSLRYTSLNWSTSDCETLQTDCETSRADCATWIVKLDSRIVKLPERIVQLGL